MTAIDKIKVLLVDDSPSFREALSRGLRSFGDFELVPPAGDPFEARSHLVRYRPHLMICDIELPRMNGITFLGQLLPSYPIPAIAISSRPEAEAAALRSGAKAFLLKPAAPTPEQVAAFIRSVARLARQYAATAPAGEERRAGLIAIGASTGGTEAIYYLLQMLPPTVPGIVIVQHIPPVFSRMFAERLHHSTSFEAREAGTGDEIRSGTVLVAPGDRHLKVVRSGGRYKAECSQGQKVNGHMPSVDMLFRSVAETAGPEAIGILLTGMGHDGAQGLLAMRQAGARTIVQDEQTSVVYGMPKAAYELGAAEFRRPIGEIAGLVQSLLQP